MTPWLMTWSVSAQKSLSPKMEAPKLLNIYMCIWRAFNKNQLQQWHVGVWWSTLWTIDTSRYMGVEPKIMGWKTPQIIIHLFICFGTMIFTIHFGGPIPLFLVQHPYNICTKYITFNILIDSVASAKSWQILKLNKLFFNKFIFVLFFMYSLGLIGYPPSLATSSPQTEKVTYKDLSQNDIGDRGACFIASVLKAGTRTKFGEPVCVCVCESPSVPKSICLFSGSFHVHFLDKQGTGAPWLVSCQRRH